MPLKLWPQVWIVCQLTWAHDILEVMWNNLCCPKTSQVRQKIFRHPLSKWSETFPRPLQCRFKRFYWFTMNSGFPHHITRILQWNWGNTMTSQQSFLLSGCCQSREAGQGRVPTEVCNSKKPSMWRGLQRSFTTQHNHCNKYLTYRGRHWEKGEK